MKRTALQRKAPLSPGTKRLTTRTPLKTTTPLRQVTKDERRRARRFAAQFGSGEHVALVKACPCADCAKPAPSDPSHWRTRGAGGKWYSIGPHCRSCHRAWEEHQGRTEERERRFAAIALWLARVSYVAGFVPEAPPEVPEVDAAAPDFIIRAAGEYLLAQRVAVRVAEVGT